MKFTCKFKGMHLKDASSGEVRKFLTKECGMSVKAAKEPIALAIRCFFSDRKHFEVANIPHVTVVAGSIDKKVMERHRNAIAEKRKNRERAEEMADENEKVNAAAAAKIRKDTKEDPLQSERPSRRVVRKQSKQRAKR